MVCLEVGVVPGMKQLLLVPPILGHAELVDAIEHLNIVQHNMAPRSEGHDAVALAKKGFSLRRKR